VGKEGIGAIVRQCVPVGKGMLAAATAGVIGGAILGSYSDVASNRDVAKFCGILGATLFAWGFLQLPIYIVSVLIARSKCDAWLRELVAVGPRLIRCQFAILRSDSSVDIRHEQVFDCLQLKHCIELATNDLLEQRRSPELSKDRHWELWCRMLLNETTATITVDRGLAFLAGQMGDAAQLSDKYLIAIEAASGKVILRRTRPSEEARQIDLGRLKLSTP